MPDARPVADDDAEDIRAKLAAVRQAQKELELAVTTALKNGASVRAVAELGLSTNTVLKYGHSHGWPREQDRARFYESRWDRARRRKD